MFPAEQTNSEDLIIISWGMERFINPVPIHDKVLWVVLIGLAVNVLSSVILDFKNSVSEHDHRHDEHIYPAGSFELNQKSADILVVAVAITSQLAIATLMRTKNFNLNSLGIVRVVLMFCWALHLLKKATVILLELEQEGYLRLADALKPQLESGGDARIGDEHIWKVAQDKCTCVMVLILDDPQPVAKVQDGLKMFPELVNVTIEMSL